MRCETAREHFSDLSEGSAESALRRAIEYHLKACPACNQEYEGFRATWKVLERIPSVDPPLDLAARIRAAVAAQDVPKPAPVPGFFARLFGQTAAPSVPVYMTRRVGWAAAVLLLVAVAFTAYVTSDDIMMRWSPVPSVKTSQSRPVLKGLDAVTITPHLEMSGESKKWSIVIGNNHEALRVREYALDAQSTDHWSPEFISSQAPTVGMKMIASKAMTDRTLRLPAAASEEPAGSVHIRVLQFTWDDETRNVAVLLPTAGDKPPVVRPKIQGMLGRAAVQFVTDYQVALVIDCGNESEISAAPGSTAFATLQNIAVQAGMYASRLTERAYQLQTF